MNKQKIFYFITLILGMITLVLTFSRGAIFIGGMSMAILLLFSHSRENGNPKIFKLIKSRIPGQARNDKKTLFIFLFTVIVFSLFTFHFSLFTSRDESVVVRQQLNMAALQLWQQSPFFGVGLGNFLVELPKALPSRTVYFLQPAHNIYLLILSETGFVGLVFFAWLVYYCLRHVTRDMRQGENKGAIFHVACRMSLVSLLALGLIDHYPLTLQQGQLLCILLLGLSLKDRK